jgi:hypothetical protein
MGINASRNLANVTRPQQKTMTGNLGFRGVFSQRRNENLTPPHEFNLSFLAIRLPLGAIISRREAAEWG